MPPKKKDDKKAQGQVIDEDISDAATLPLLNDFIFFNLYAFKYRRNRLNLEKMLFQEFYIPTEGETAEIAKRNRVIQISDLLQQAKAKSYLTEEESLNIGAVEEVRLRQALARSTNELLISIIMPLRRQKAEQDRLFQETLDKMTNEKEKEAAKKQRFEKTSKDIELTIWLKDFPRDAMDFQEIRRSNAQHQPDVEVAIHGIFMIEEMFKRDAELDDGPIAGMEQNKLDDEELKRINNQQFKKDDRIKAFKDLAYLNKYARKCPSTSQMKLSSVLKLPFFGPDPPIEPPEKNPASRPQSPPEEVKDVKKGKDTKDKKGAKVVEEEKPVEIPKSPEEMAELAVIFEFVKSFRDQVTSAGNDLSSYRALMHPVFGLQKVPLWPKTYTKEELEQARLKKEEEERARKAQEEAEAEQRRKEEEAAKAKGGAKGKAPAKPDPKAAAKPAETRPTTSEGRPQTQQAPADSQLSMDDRKVDWNFECFQKVMAEMDSGHTTVGSMMAAMVYQIEKQSSRPIQQPVKQNLMTHRSSKSVVSINSQKEPTEQDKLGSELDQLFEKLKVEHAVVEDEFNHKKPAKVDPRLKGSPYQLLYNHHDKLSQGTEAYTFLNGKTASDYEANILEAVRQTWIKYLFKMPERETRKRAERESDTSAILKYSPLESHMTKRLIVLKHFEDLLQAENPERTYEFTKRNCTEELYGETFRQVLCDAMRLNPDINTCYYDKEDALLLAINFKNPPGRLLRRQWTYPIKTMVDFPEYRKFVSGEKLSFSGKVIDIGAENAGVLRTNSKYCFPCDNSVIRIDKHNVGSRRFGSSVVTKDNFKFGLKESPNEVQEKVFGDDELLNMETKRSLHRNGELWIEFENKTRMHVKMNAIPDVQEDLIPVLGEQQPSSSPKKTVSIDENANPMSAEKRADEPPRVGSAISNLSEKRIQLQSQSTQQEQSIGSEIPEQPIETKQIPGYDPNKGASITFTFNEGLVVNIKQNGDIEQQNLNLLLNKAKKSAVLQEEKPEASPEVSRVVTRQAVIIKTLKDDNKVLYFPDGTITYTDNKRGIWSTVNPKGILRERNIRSGTAFDVRGKFQIVTKVDPETAAVVDIRDDGLLKITYVDRRTLLIFPDKTQMLITKTGPMEEGSTVTTTLVLKENYAPVRITFDAVKARSNTIIGLGGTDALMGKDNIMERSNGGLISEVLMPDRTILQTYFEKQELPGYNRFSSSLIHLARRDDFSVIKVRQDGEVVIITSNERAYLNEIGKQEEFGKTDYDYFFELFGVPNERRSGVYTCNLEQGRLWTQDEEGNYFIVYANGDSTEKLSVSFNLDQMVEGIENKEPSSPRVSEGEYIEEECKFLPPPKSVAEPRLFLCTSKGATEFFSENQLDYTFRTQHKDETVIKSEKKVTIENEPAISHRFTKMVTEFIPEQPSTLPKDCLPKLPQCLDMVNQTVIIPQEPQKNSFLWRNILQYRVPTDNEVKAFHNALQQKDELRANQATVSKKLKIEPRELPAERIANQNSIMLRIARKRGLDVQGLLAEEYRQIKVIDRDEKRQQCMDSLDDWYSPDKAEQETVGSETNE